MAPTGVAIGSAPIDGGSAFEGGGGSSSSSDDMIELALGCWGDSESVARRLFSALRRADELQVAAIVVEGVAESGAGMAVMNRLRKAASRVVTLSAGREGGHSR
jgi:L-threonylcarbamoyladenylate synthase